ncbi:hypothetical protein J1N35_040793, partial [Gossypium stocksii]
NFSIAEMYKHLFNNSGPRRSGLLTNEERTRRSMTSIPFCEQCGCGNSKISIASATAWARSFGNNGGMEQNIDGLMSTSRKKAAVGGVFRGPIGGWLVGFEMVIGMADIFQIEARAIFEGLKLAWMRGFRQVDVERDNALLIDTIRNNFVANSIIVEVRLIHEWCNKDWQVKLRHVRRESNKVVDCFAKTAGGGINQLFELVDPPSHVRRLLEEDIDSSI